MRCEKGFTLIELLVAMAIAAIVMAGIYKVYYSQQKSYLLQDQMAAMQQNLRTAMFFMTREIRMAGCDPTRQAGAGFVTATSNTVRFTEDVRGKGQDDEPDGDTSDPNEDISYYLSGSQLIRSTPSSGALPIADNIDALYFVYLDANGAVLSSPVSLGNIRSVVVTVVARTGIGDLGYSDQTSYTDQWGNTIWTAQGDSFRRKVLTTRINCRNLGL